MQRTQIVFLYSFSEDLLGLVGIHRDLLKEGLFSFQNRLCFYMNPEMNTFGAFLVRVETSGAADEMNG